MITKSTLGANFPGFSKSKHGFRQLGKKARTDRNVYGDKSRMEKYHMTMFGGDESKGEEHHRSPVTSSPMVMTEPASLVTPATLNITNASIIASSVSSAGTDLLALPPAPLSTTSSTNLLERKFTSATHIATPAPCAASEQSMAEVHALSVVGLPSDSTLAHETGADRGASDVASLSPEKPRTVNCEAVRTVSSKLARKQIGLKSLASYLQDIVSTQVFVVASGMWEILYIEIQDGEDLSKDLVRWTKQGPENNKLDLQHGIVGGPVCQVKYAATHPPAEVASLDQGGESSSGLDGRETHENLPTTKGQGASITDPENSFTGYSPGVTSALSLSLGASHSYGPPTVRHSPGRSNLQQTKDPDNIDNKKLASHCPSLPGAARDTLLVDAGDGFICPSSTTELQPGVLSASILDPSAARELFHDVEAADGVRDAAATTWACVAPVTELQPGVLSASSMDPSAVRELFLDVEAADGVRNARDGSVCPNSTIQTEAESSNELLQPSATRIREGCVSRQGAGTCKDGAAGQISAAHKQGKRQEAATNRAQVRVASAVSTIRKLSSSCQKLASPGTTRDEISDPTTDVTVIETEDDVSMDDKPAVVNAGHIMLVCYTTMLSTNLAQQEAIVSGSDLNFRCDVFYKADEIQLTYSASFKFSSPYRFWYTVIVTERKYTSIEFYVAFMNERAFNGLVIIASSEAATDVGSVGAGSEQILHATELTVPDGKITKY